jgi:uncharacterized membrane protein YwzB
MREQNLLFFYWSYGAMHHSRTFKNQKGKGAIGCIVFIIILLGLLYAAFQYSRPYIKRSMMEGKLDYLASWALENPHYDNKFIIKSVLNGATELSIDLDPENIQMERTKESLTISLYWEDDIDLPYYHKHLEFNIEKTKKVKE